MRLRSLGFAILLATTLAALTGCGWHLQGNTRLSETMAVTYIDTKDRYTDFNRALRDSLRASGARLARDKREATAIVRILSESSGQRVLTVSARNTPEEYEVYYAIEYAVFNQSEELIEPQRIELTREYSYDVTAVLAKQREESLLREALARDLAALVLRRLSAL
jgi:LPS-assembly lipoprotein